MNFNCVTNSHYINNSLETFNVQSSNIYVPQVHTGQRNCKEILLRCFNIVL